ncbi:MAG: TonB-dependent receptor [Lysobacterales bacterium]
MFTQDVDTWYINLGLDGRFGNGTTWNVDYVHSENKAEQTFYNGFNVGHLKLALGDVNLCNATPGCVPLDLFGGEGRPITPAMRRRHSTDQHDASKQVLDLINANITGDLFAIGDRHAGYALGVEHRRYQGDFNPDPLRQTGESQDSFAAPISASYNVNEIYGEMQVPWTASFSTDFALRYSDYSTFGGATTGKLGLRWQPIQDLVLRGIDSEGFRAPNLGELYGLTQFGATLTDPCGTTGSPGPRARIRAGLRQRGRADELRAGQYADHHLHRRQSQPESREVEELQPGAVWSPSWAENCRASKLDEFDYFHYKVTDAIQAPDIQSELNNCYANVLSGVDPSTLPGSGFVRDPAAGNNLKPPTDFLANLGTITTSGIDLKANWLGPECRGQLRSAAVHPQHQVRGGGQGRQPRSARSGSRSATARFPPG